MKGLRTTIGRQTSHGDVKYGIGNIVNNIIMYCARWVPEILGGLLSKL